MRPALVLAVLVSSLVALPASATGSDRVALSGPRVTMFGDSVAESLAYVPEARQFLGGGLDLQLHLASCRRLASPSCPYMGARPPSVLDIVQESTPAQLGRIVVVDVGYNEPAVNYEGGMAVVAQALVNKGVEQVIWVTMREETDEYRRINRVIRAQAPRWPQVRIADWEGASRGKDWFNSDGLHLNADGAVGLATLLRPFVLSACGAACETAPPPTGEAAPRNTRQPVLRGSPVVGQLLTCRPGSWTGPRPIVLTYRWLRNGKLIADAVGPERRLRPADRSRQIACRVWAANSIGVAAATSKPRLVRPAP
jgi:hypothetical protein